MRILTYREIYFSNIRHDIYNRNSTSNKGAPLGQHVLTNSGVTHQIDKRFETDVYDAQFTNQIFLRLVAKGRRFTRVDFKYSIFDSCYLRSCTFDSCDFIGCRFVSTNLHGSTFSGCKFDYAMFEKTFVESEILNDGCPGHENLKMRFARTLRTNYQQLGDAKSVNKAISVELEATEAHLRKAWKSNESYYRRKYGGIRRVTTFFEWLAFKTLDFLWGNGESPLKLVRAIAFALLVIAGIEADIVRESYWHAALETLQVLIGAISPATYARGCAISVLCVRLVAFGFLTAIIVKRFNRR